MNKQVYFRFYEELNDFLPPNLRKKEFVWEYIDKTTVKDMIEAIGVPHPEIDLILINGGSVGFESFVTDGDRISVYPEFESMDISPVQKLRPTPLRNPKFVLDVHLGTLARQMRMLGIDTYYANDLSDEKIIEISQKEKRAILTRDLGILKSGKVTRGYWVRNTNPDEQIIEILRRFQLEKQLSPFSRCISCNGELAPVEKSKVESRLPDKVKGYYDIFFQCAACDKVYWKGTHFEDMRKKVEKIMSAIK